MLEDLLLERNYQQVVYLGDGKGDYCPCTRLGPKDCVLARQSYPDGSPCALFKLLADGGAAMKDSRQALRSMVTVPLRVDTKGSRQANAFPVTDSSRQADTFLTTGGSGQASAFCTTEGNEHANMFTVTKHGQHNAAASTRTQQQQQAEAEAQTAQQRIANWEAQHKAKRHKAQHAEQPGTQDVPFCRHPTVATDAATIDCNKCLDTAENISSEHQTGCPEDVQGLPLPPARATANAQQLQIDSGTSSSAFTQRGCADSVGEAIKGTAYSKGSISASVYSWTQASDAADMLQALLHLNKVS